MNYQETIDYLYHTLPMFSRIGAAAIKKDITNTVRLCEALGNPQHKFKSIHIAGTNGKGSTSHMLAAILQTAGYKTGLYTSPHLKDFRERIKVNGMMCEEQFVVDFTKRIQPLINEIEPSFFEITVAMAFEYFVEQKVDFSKNSNMVLGAITFVVGVSGASVSIGTVQLKGMAFSAIIGVILSLIFWSLTKLGIMNKEV